MKLKGKDLMNIGVFTAIYLVLTTIVAVLGFIPIFIPLLIVFVPIIGGIPMMLYYAKIKTFGMLTITGIICGIFMILTGMGYWSVITGLLFGLIADVIVKLSDYKSSFSVTISYGLFSMWLLGNYLPIVFTRDSYYKELISNYSQEYADKLMGYMPLWMIPLLAAAGFVSGIIGSFIGRKIFDKHFKKAGVV
jgi:energy-coupling factor transport system substrate-specific component